MHLPVDSLKSLAHRAWLAAGIFVALAAPQGALAQGSMSSTTTYRGDSSVAMVDMFFGRSITPVVYNGDDEATDLDNGYLVISLMGDFGGHTLAGFRFGYVSPTPDDRLATEGINLSGYSLGLEVDGQYALVGESTFVLAGASIDFVNAFGSNDRQSTDYEWWTAIARLGLAQRISRVEIGAGVSYRNLEGKETTSGDVDSTTKFEIDRNDALFLELDFNTSPGGHVGLTLESGATENWYFYFRRFF